MQRRVSVLVVEDEILISNLVTEALGEPAQLAGADPAGGPRLGEALRGQRDAPGQAGGQP